MRLTAHLERIECIERVSESQPSFIRRFGVVPTSRIGDVEQKGKSVAAADQQHLIQLAHRSDVKTFIGTLNVIDVLIPHDVNVARTVSVNHEVQFEPRRRYSLLMQIAEYGHSTLQTGSPGHGVGRNRGMQERLLHAVGTV